MDLFVNDGWTVSDAGYESDKALKAPPALGIGEFANFSLTIDSIDMFGPEESTPSSRTNFNKLKRDI